MKKTSACSRRWPARAAGGQLADQFTQQEVVRRFDARLGAVMRVLRHLGELGLVERKPGNGWAFVPDPARILNESYAFRRALEPQMLLQPGLQAGPRLGGKGPRASTPSCARNPGSPATAPAFMP